MAGQNCQQDVPALPRLACGRYETAKKLGSGTFGTVVQARDLHKDGAQVAIKYLRRDGMRQPGHDKLAQREIENHSALKHPHVRLPVAPRVILCLNVISTC